jgi:hypothetical protein
VAALLLAGAAIAARSFSLSIPGLLTVREAADALGGREGILCRLATRPRRSG